MIHGSKIPFFMDKKDRWRRPTYSSMDDSQWITRCYDKHASALYAYALVVTSTAADAEEVLQTVFEKLVKKPEN
jgi:DNA-directed RNA polymerase specialized sigma24 family protein